MYPNQNYYGYNQQNPYSYGAMPDSLAQMRGQTISQAIPQVAPQPQNNLTWKSRGGQQGARVKPA